MFLRFVVPHRDDYSHRLTGVFLAAHRLRSGGLLGEEDDRALADLLRWFNSRLPVPYRFSRSRRRNALPNAICWLKDRAALHLRKVRELARLLERHGITTRELRTARPGYIVYEDVFQVAAVPFRDTGA
jgi:hypothetical protein